MKAELTRDLVESLNDSIKQEYAQTINDFMFTLVENALSDIEAKSPFIKMDKCVMVPVDEVYLGSFCQLSEYNYYVGIDNPEIAFNSQKKRNWWKYVWREFKAAWRIGRKKKYKKKKKGEPEEVKPVTFDKYTINDLKHDLVNKMANYLQETSMIYEYNDHISLVGTDDFGTGVKVNLFVCYFETNTNTFKMYRESKNKFVDINFANRYTNLDKKLEWVGDMFVNVAKLLNSVYAKTYGVVPNQVIVESLLYQCPNNLFDKNDVYKSFVDIANYIRFRDPRTWVSICDESTPLLQDKLVQMTGSSPDFSRIINMLDNFKY